MITKLEFQVLEAIVKSEFHDGRHPIESYVWVSELDVPSNLKKSGVMGSLVKKRMVKTNGESCCVSELGFAEYEKARLKIKFCTQLKCPNCGSKNIHKGNDYYCPDCVSYFYEHELTLKGGRKNE